MVTFKAFVCLGYLFSFLVKQSEPQCIGGGNNNGLPSFTNYGNDGFRITLHHQAIIPSYEFQCCGNVTEWGVDVQSGGGGDDAEYTLDLQVWRPSPTVNGSTGAGQYMLIGNNRFTSISLNNDVAQVTPLTRDQVQFRPGDVLGFYVEEARVNNNGVNALTTDSFTLETVWYASVTTLNTMGCPVSVGSIGVLNTLLQGAPVISIDTTTYNCPQITSTPPPYPTATCSTNPSSTTTTPQPTIAPSVPTTTEPLTDEISPFNPTTDEPTSELATDILKPISFILTPTETSTDVSMPTSTPSLHTSSIILPVIIGTVTSLIVCSVVILVVIVIFLWLKAKRFKKAAVSVATNPAYEVNVLKTSATTHSEPNPRERNLQDLTSKIDMDTSYDIVMNQNDAYISNCMTERSDDIIATERNDAYISSCVTQRSDDIIATERNDAYISNCVTQRSHDIIATERNEAYSAISNANTGSENTYKLDASYDYI